jgi:transposase
MRAQAQGESQAQQQFRLRELLCYNLKTVRAYLLKEDFQQI